MQSPNPSASAYTLADVSESSDDSDLSGEHDIGGPLDSIDQRLPTTVVVVELALGDRVVDVDGGNLESSLPESLVQVVNSGSGLLGNTLDLLEHLGVLLVNERGEVTTVIQEHVGGLTVGELAKQSGSVQGDLQADRRARLTAVNCCSMHQVYSSSVSPFQAKTGTPVAAMAAAAWSWVEKMLHDDQVTWAPRWVRVSMRTALRICAI
jgi:hypothetical protein